MNGGSQLEKRKVMPLGNWLKLFMRPGNWQTCYTSLLLMFPREQNSVADKLANSSLVSCL